MPNAKMQPAKPWRKMLALSMTLFALTSMIGCAGRYVVVQGEETIQVKKSTLDNLQTDNERLLEALEKCQQKK